MWSLSAGSAKRSMDPISLDIENDMTSQKFDIRQATRSGAPYQQSRSRGSFTSVIATHNPMYFQNIGKAGAFLHLKLVALAIVRLYVV